MKHKGTGYSKEKPHTIALVDGVFHKTYDDDGYSFEDRWDCGLELCSACSRMASIRRFFGLKTIRHLDQDGNEILNW